MLMKLKLPNNYNVFIALSINSNGQLPTKLLWFSLIIQVVLQEVQYMVGGLNYAKLGQIFNHYILQI